MPWTQDEIVEHNLRPKYKGGYLKKEDFVELMGFEMIEDDEYLKKDEMSSKEELIMLRHAQSFELAGSCSKCPTVFVGGQLLKCFTPACENRQKHIECNVSCSNNCQNQPFRKMQWFDSYRLKYFEGRKLVRVIAMRSIVPWSYLHYFSGQVRRKRSEEGESIFVRDFVKDVKDELVIDSSNKGTVLRHMRHDKNNANCVIYPILTNGRLKLVIVAVKSIQEEDEMTWMYWKEYKSLNQTEENKDLEVENEETELTEPLNLTWDSKKPKPVIFVYYPPTPVSSVNNDLQTIPSAAISNIASTIQRSSAPSLPPSICSDNDQFLNQETDYDFHNDTEDSTINSINPLPSSNQDEFGLNSTQSTATESARNERVLRSRKRKLSDSGNESLLTPIKVKRKKIAQKQDGMDNLESEEMSSSITSTRRITRQSSSKISIPTATPSSPPLSLSTSTALSSVPISLRSSTKRSKASSTNGKPLPVSTIAVTLKPAVFQYTSWRVPTQQQTETDSASKTISLKCEECPLKPTFCSKGNLNKHKRQFHSDRDRIECPTCSQIFPVHGNYQRHLLRHLSQNERPQWKCPSCPKKYSRKDTCMSHIRRSRTCKGEPIEVSPESK